MKSAFAKYAVIAIQMCVKIPAKVAGAIGEAQNHIALCLRSAQITGGLTMNENKMAQVAELFGKKLGEKFKTTFIANSVFVFTPDGIQEIYDGHMFAPNPYVLEAIIKGTVKIVEGK